MISHRRIRSQYTFQAALYLGLRQKEWLFLSCHNYWIVFRLVKERSEPAFLAFSPLITMNDSSVPFRAFLGAILSVSRKITVQASAFDDSQILETIDEGEAEEKSSSTYDGSGEYRSRPGQGPIGSGPITHRRAQGPSNEAALMVRPCFALFISTGHLTFISIDFVVFPTVS